ncbi:hypothetical protein ABIA25_004846 [Sinorhizobium fredii]
MGEVDHPHEAHGDGKTDRNHEQHHAVSERVDRYAEDGLHEPILLPVVRSLRPRIHRRRILLQRRKAGIALLLEGRDLLVVIGAVLGLGDFAKVDVLGDMA